MNYNKDLADMSSEELGKLFPIMLEEYNKKWVDYFNSEEISIYEAFDPYDIISLEHIGSTAIPGIKAKPTIDILIEVSDMIENNKIIGNFMSLGYRYIYRATKPPPHMMFVKGYTIHGFKGQAFHVHVRYKGDWNEIYFRNYLREHREFANEYEKLKLKLAKKYKYDRDAYTEAKTEFIEKVNQLAREVGND